MNSNIEKFIQQADLVTTTTEFLAKEYRKLNKNVIVLPNQIDPFNYEEPIKNTGDKIRVGLVGSVSSNDEYLHILDALDYLKARDDVEIVVFGLPDKDDARLVNMRKIYQKELDFWEKYADERKPFVSMANYYETLNNLRLDLMLIPRQESYFNKCKSNIKFLEASMFEIPVIAQGFTKGDSPYDRDLCGNNGFIVKTGHSWIPTIKKLLDDKKLRQRVGKTAKKYVLKHYNIEQNYKLWDWAYKSIK
jgi:glycosyltransferase involved in cell wall biosynthesis